MANTEVYFKEIKFVIEDKCTHCYVLLDAYPDAPIQILGWHHKEFPLEVNCMDILKGFGSKDDEKDPMFWEKRFPKDTGVMLIAEERKRQINVEEWTSEHDSLHNKGEMASLASLYAYPDNRYENKNFTQGSIFKAMWPQTWDPKWWKPTPDNRIKELTKAGALIAAEIDRLLNI